jgi:fructose-1,6-bisphosphatase/inositol monophosphatase family enzyme
MPALGDQYWGSRAGAFHNGVALPQLVAADFDESLGFLAVPSNAHLLYDITFPRLRSLGSTAAHLVYVARGAAVAALTRQVKLWDLAGVMPVLEHAGIALGYLSGAPFDGRDLMHGKAAAEPLLAAHPSWMERIRETIRLKRSDPAR